MVCFRDWSIFITISLLSPQFFFHTVYWFKMIGCKDATPKTFSCFSLLTAKAAVDKTMKSSRVGVYQAQVSGSGWGWCSRRGMQMPYSNYLQYSWDHWKQSTVPNLPSAHAQGASSSSWGSGTNDMFGEVYIIIPWLWQAIALASRQVNVAIAYCKLCHR